MQLDWIRATSDTFGGAKVALPPGLNNTSGSQTKPFSGAKIAPVLESYTFSGAKIAPVLVKLHLWWCLNSTKGVKLTPKSGVELAPKLVLK